MIFSYIHIVISSVISFYVNVSLYSFVLIIAHLIICNGCKSMENDVFL